MAGFLYVRLNWKIDLEQFNYITKRVKNIPISRLWFRILSLFSRCYSAVIFSTKLPFSYRFFLRNDRSLPLFYRCFLLTNRRFFAVFYKNEYIMCCPPFCRRFFQFFLVFASFSDLIIYLAHRK